MDSIDDASDEAIMACWYDYAADEPGFVGYWLRLLREREGVTAQEQRTEFGADASSFLWLQAMPLPQTHSLARDAHRIAERCSLKNPIAFVQAMILARNLESTGDRATVEEFYQAAFDEEVDLE